MLAWWRELSAEFWEKRMSMDVGANMAVCLIEVSGLDFCFRCECELAPMLVTQFES